MLISLALGLFAALCWGVHDLLVRVLVSPANLFSALLTVLLLGTMLQMPVSVLAMQSQPIPMEALAFTMLSGVLYAFAGIALYKAFIIGPVRTVAPIIGAYPLLSVLYASLAGDPLTAQQILAVVVVISAAGYVSASEDKSTDSKQQKTAIAWALFAALGFASSFGSGQMASEMGDELSLLAPNRLTSLLTVALIAAAVGAPIALAKTQRHLWLLMAFLDTAAHSAVISSGKLDHPSLASVGASIFGLITVILAAIFLKEKLSPTQWLAVATVFAAIAYLCI